MARCAADKIPDRIVQFYKNIHGKPVLYISRCKSPATVTLLSGCVHEHLTTWDCCAGCAAAALAQVADNKFARCVPCAAPGANAHRCPVLVETRELAAVTL